MKNRTLVRLLCALLAACMLPIGALAATGDIPLDQPITDTDFSVSLQLNANAFPESSSRLTDWESFLKRVTVTGSAVGMDLLGRNNRLRLLADVNLDGKSVLPLHHEQYAWYYYLTSPVFGEDTLHFQMNNFFGFMLKPYFFMGLPTQYIGLLLYPMSTAEMIRMYYDPLAAICEGTGERTIPYDELRALCLKLDENMTSDWSANAYNYIRALLLDMGGDEMTIAGLSELEGYLDELDPEKAGLTIHPHGNQTDYLMGGRTLLTVKRTGEAFSVALDLPKKDDYELKVNVSWTPTVDGAALDATLHILKGEEDAMLLRIAGDGMPTADNLEGEGNVTAEMSGSMAYSNPAPVKLHFTWYKSQKELPYDLHFSVGYLHPETGLEALTLFFSGKLSEGTAAELDYDTPIQEDFFRMNNDKLAAFREKYAKNIALVLAPVVLQMPSGVIDSVMDFLLQSDILYAFFGE